MEEKEKEIKNRILSSAQELFMTYGFKSITMDEIAKNLAISKKTIYQYFQDKDDIVRECVSHHLGCEKILQHELFSNAQNPVEEFYIEMQQLRLTLSRMHPAVIFELKKYHPKAWEIFESHKQNWIIQSVKDNLKRGKDLGYYRSDIIIDIMAKLRVEEVTIGWDPVLFPSHLYDMKTIQMQFIEHFLYGILTDKGRDILNQITQHYLLTNNEYENS